ncbi:hypothetical protein [Mannheimia indoligenes]|uniref:hypothetical protein n=1 Tax=Mannheimia indoligenes TaxID=3103145 RepID=UPI002FE5B05E
MGLSDMDKSKMNTKVIEKFIDNFYTYHHDLMSKLKSENKDKYLLTFGINNMSDEDKTNLVRTNFMSEFNSEFLALVVPDNIKFYITNSLSTNIKKRWN